MDAVTRRAKAVRLMARAKELGALRFGSFTLSSGQPSRYYFDGRMLTLDPEGADLISEIFLDWILAAGAVAAGGPAAAAIPIAGALAVRGGLEGRPVRGFFVRPGAKAHGAGRQVEGPVEPGMKVAVFDDTISTGASLLAALDAMEELGCEVVLVMCVLDRRQGGGDEVWRRGIPFYAMWESDASGNLTLCETE